MSQHYNINGPAKTGILHDNIKHLSYWLIWFCGEKWAGDADRFSASHNFKSQNITDTWKWSWGLMHAYCAF